MRCPRCHQQAEPVYEMGIVSPVAYLCGCIVPSQQPAPVRQHDALKDITYLPPLPTPSERDAQAGDLIELARELAK